MQYVHFKPFIRFKFWALCVQICLALISVEAQAKPNFGACVDYFQTREIVILKGDESIVHQSIQTRIREAQRRRNTPILVFDIEGTVYTIQSRILRILQNYDADKGTKYFENMTIDRIDPNASFSFIKWAVSQKEFNKHVKDRVIEEIIQHLKSELNKSRNYKYDTVFDKVRYMMQEYARMGARIVLVTERRDLAKDATERQLKRDGIPYDELRMRPESPEPLDIQKLTHVDEVARYQDGELIAYFDDVQGLHDFMGDMGLFDTYQVFVKTRFKRDSNNEDGFTFRFYHPDRRSYR